MKGTSIDQLLDNQSEVFLRKPVVDQANVRGWLFMPNLVWIRTSSLLHVLIKVLV
jgi:hypothetical protein